MPFVPLTAAFAWPGLELAFAAEPCFGESVSGDGVFVETGRGDGGVMLLLVDVMGHGVPAAQIVRTLQTHHLPDPRYQDLPPAQLLEGIHQALECDWPRTGRFAAGQAVLLDAQAGQVEVANAAIPEPRCGQPGSAWFAWSLPPAPPLGLPLPAPMIQSVTTTLLPNHYVLLFTDGVTEAGWGKATQFQHGPFPPFPPFLLGCRVERHREVWRTD